MMSFSIYIVVDVEVLCFKVYELQVYEHSSMYYIILGGVLEVEVRDINIVN